MCPLLLGPLVSPVPVLHPSAAPVLLCAPASLRLFPPVEDMRTWEHSIERSKFPSPAQAIRDAKARNATDMDKHVLQAYKELEQEELAAEKAH
mmetsp:Transcript_49417/g.77221  ORF Transcript_49417/g.77221 Transcript_49417/m.77221 type:complete len:93 (-) Transcript_49417:88-366(-)